MMKNDNFMPGLYVHIPFCRYKCHYCDFSTFVHAEKWIGPYMESLKEELLALSKDIKVKEWKTLYFGGGTPSFIGAGYLKEWMDTFLHLYPLPKVEITLEANPEDIHLSNIRAWKKLGINRISIGIQSHRQDLLKQCGRIYLSDWKEKILLLKREGIENISVDLIGGLPGQKIQDLLEAVKETVSLGVKHLSLYSLILEEKTYFGYLYGKDKLALPEEDEEREMIHQAKALLESYGYHHYEISNFALPTYEAIHNTMYWKRIPYIGLGLSAASFWEGKRWTNTHTLSEYLHNAGSKAIRKEEEFITKEEALSEAMILGLRLVDGIDLKKIQARYGQNPMDIFGGVIEKHLQGGLLCWKQGKLAFTKMGLDLSDKVNRDLLW